MPKVTCVNIVLTVILVMGSLPIPAQATAVRAPQAQAGALQVWTEHSAHKVQPSTVPGAGASLTLEGARRSYEAAQIIVRANGAALSGVNLTAGALQDGAGHTLAAENFTFYREYFINFTGVEENEPGNVPVPAESPTDDPWIPDPLIPFIDPYTGNPAGAPFAVTAGQNQPVWVDISIPENTVAGVYTGVITVTATGQTAEPVPVTLTVWDLTLPDKNSVTTYFQAGTGELLYYHRNIYDCNGSDCWLSWNATARQLVKRYETMLHTHRLDTRMNFIPDPEAGSACAVPTGWSAYDAAVQPYMDGSYWDDGVPNAWLAAPFTPGAPWGIEATCSDAQYTQLAQSWATHLKAQGWFTRSIAYAVDEPAPDLYADIAYDSQLMQSGGTGWKPQIMDTVSAAPETSSLFPALGIFCQCLRCYDHWWQNQTDYGRAEWPSLFAQGTQLWFYESNAQSDPYPTFATNTLLGMEPRMVLWGSWYEKASGFLLWDTIAWDADSATGGPWGPNVDYGKSGDGVLLYPGNHDGLNAPMGSPSGVAIDGPVPSYRLKVIRQGLQDWALFKLAEQRGWGEYARQQVARVYGQFGGCDWSGCPDPVNGSFYWLTDAALMDEIRHNIAMVLSTNHAPNLPTNPRPADGAGNVFTNPIFSWEGGDPDGDVVTYTVALGLSSPPPVTATLTLNSYQPALLAGNTHFYWQITATDGLSSTVGPVWQFTTGVTTARRLYLPVTHK